MIVRGERVDRFTTISNVLVEDIRLSWKARGLLVFLLSKPDHWETSYRHLMTCGPDGQASVLSGLKELEACGYLVRVKRRMEDGTVATVSIVYDAPQDDTVRGFPTPGQSTPTVRGLSTPGKPTHRVKTEVVKTEETLSLVPPEPRKSTATPTLHERAFEEVWPIYPRKIGKRPAMKAFVARLRAGVPLADLAQATRNYAHTCRDKEPNFVMHGSTFFGPNERWRDYLNGNPDGQREYVPEYLR